MMIKKIFFFGYLLLSITCIVHAKTAYILDSGNYNEHTKVLKSGFKATQIRGEKRLMFQAIDKEFYPLFLNSADDNDGLILTFDSAIKNKTTFSEQSDLHVVFDESRGNKMVIKAAKPGLKGKRIINVVLEDLEVNIEVWLTPKSYQSNRIVYFQQHLKEKTLQSVKLKDLVSQRDSLVNLFNQLATQKLNRHDIKQEYLVNKTTTLKLEYVVSGSDTLSFVVTSPVDISKRYIQIAIKPTQLINFRKSDNKSINIPIKEVISLTNNRYLVHCDNQEPANRFAYRISVENVVGGTDVVFEGQADLIVANSKKPYLFNSEAR